MKQPHTTPAIEQEDYVDPPKMLFEVCGNHLVPLDRDKKGNPRTPGRRFLTPHEAAKHFNMDVGDVMVLWSDFFWDLVGRGEPSKCLSDAELDEIRAPQEGKFPRLAV